MKKLLILIISLVLALNASSQDKKVKYLGLVFKQEHYRKVIRVSEKLIYKKGYDKNAKVFLYQASALAKLSQDHNYTDIHPNALDNAIRSYSAYFKLDKNNNFAGADEELLSLLRKTFKNKIDSQNTEEALVYLLKKKAKTTSSKIEETDSTKEKDSSIKIPEIKRDTLIIKEIDRKLPLEDQIVCYAKNYLGIPYLYGGKSDRGFDCSGYTSYILEEFGFNLPRSARDQYSQLEKVPLKKVKKGDLVFFGKSKSRVSHVGLVISNEGEELTMIHASSSKGIMVSNVETNVYWKPKLVSAGRIIN